MGKPVPGGPLNAQIGVLSGLRSSENKSPRREGELAAAAGAAIAICSITREMMARNDLWARLRAGAE